MISQPLSELQKKDLESQVRGYQEQLKGSGEALEYLAGRGLSEETVEQARLGFVADAAQGHEKFAGRIVIPYLTTSGPVGVRFRKLPSAPEGVPKYQDVSGPMGKPRLYNVQSLAQDPGGSRVYVAEGEIDTLTAMQMGLTAVGISGVSKWQPFWKLLLEGYEQVFVLADNDDKGQGAEMAEAIANHMSNHDVRTVLMPSGHDVNSAFLEGGREALLDWIHGRN